MAASFRELIDRFGIGEFASAIGVSYGAAKQMRRRDSVGAEYLELLYDACRSRGMEDVTAEGLLKLARTSRDHPEITDAAEAGA